MKQEGTTSNSTPSRPQNPAKRQGTTGKGSEDTGKPLDFNKLDLTIDRVDERISPSETNIFDK